ncbi:MAG: MFS transporter [Candidatus Omnitrophica bacterium]|nr:MFS transporter [Candidatus Omnitrophota bacterium]MDD5436247.1 MFS transporter [Candidatus Omnitrophota bacterium]
MEEYIVHEKRQQVLIIFSVVLSVFIFSVDFSMLNISLPTLSIYFHTGIGAVAFLPMAYMLIVTSSLLGFGKIGDLAGYRRVFIGGLAVFMIASLLCSFAPSLRLLLMFRIIQAFGEAMMSPMGIAILTTFLPKEMRGLSLGLVALAQGLGFASGNIIGGYINSHFVWRGIFFVNIPIILLTILLSLKALPAKQRRSDDKSFDLPGALLIFAGMAGLVYGMNLLGKLKSSPSVIAASFMIAAIGLGLFFIREKKVKYPILDLALFKNKNFSFSNLAAFMVVAVLMGGIFITPFYLEILRRLSVMQVGTYLVIAPLTMLFVAPVAGRLSDSIGSRTMCAVGATMEGVAFLILSILTPVSHLSLVAIALVTLGFAAGIFMAPNNKLVMSHAPEDKQGVASGIYKISLSTGGVFGIALFPIVIIRTLIAAMGTSNINMELTKHSPAMLQPGFRNMFISGVVMSALAVIFSVLAKDATTK